MDLEKAERNQRSNCQHLLDHQKSKIIPEKKKKNTYFCFTDYAKAFDCVDHNKMWKILQKMEIPDRLTCLLKNLYAGQEATVRTAHGTTDWFQIRKEYIVMPDVQIPEQEEIRPPRQCNSQKGKFIADSSQGSCRIQHSGAGSESPKLKLLHKFIG